MNCKVEIEEKNSLVRDLRRFDLWGSVSESVIDQVLESSTVVRKPKGTPLSCNESNDNSALVIVLSGIIKMYGLSETGRGIFIRHVEAGELCPLSLSKLMGTPMMEAQAVAETDVSLLVVNRECFYTLLEQSNVFRTHVLKETIDFAKDLVTLVKQICFQKLPTRVADFLVKMFNKRRQKIIPFTHQSLANELGTTREVMSRLLKDFETRGYIKLQRGAIEVLSEENLLMYMQAR